MRRLGGRRRRGMRPLPEGEKENIKMEHVGRILIIGFSPQRFPEGEKENIKMKHVGRILVNRILGNEILGLGRNRENRGS